MRIDAISIRNFRGIRELELQAIGDLVVLVGPNGSGKSSAFDAIRFTKSIYGDYDPQQQHELSYFFNEFQVSPSDQALHDFARYPDRDIELDITFSIASEERTHIASSAHKLLAEFLARKHRHNISGPLQPLSALVYRTTHGTNLQKQVEQLASPLLEGLTTPLTASVRIRPDGNILVNDNLPLSILLSVYDPSHIGILDYHGAHRTFQREKTSQSAKTAERADRYRQHALYNYSNKYTNLKSELSELYLRDILVSSRTTDLANLPSSRTLRDLFTTFLPAKRFTAPTVSQDGSLLFEVEESDISYDIDDLSAGEREVIFGYARLLERNFRNSIILIDEPELHLNDRISATLPAFYRRNLVEPGQNQVWLSTHSEQLLRRAQAERRATIVALEPASCAGAQATVISTSSLLDQAIASLAGITYSPRRRVLLLEGDGDEFDKDVVTTLFPDYATQLNIISAGPKSRVIGLIDHLNSVARQCNTDLDFIAIVDRDLGAKEQQDPRLRNAATWDVYHIENYLLEPAFILLALKEILRSKCHLLNEADTTTALHDIASELKYDFIREQLQSHTNDMLRRALAHDCPMARVDLHLGLHREIDRVTADMRRLLTTSLSETSLRSLEEQLSQDLDGALGSKDGWRTEFRGRDILIRFASKHGKGVPYHVLRNVILARMRDAQYRPVGMESVLKKVASGPARARPTSTKGTS